MNNPNFAPAAGLFSEVVASVMASILFTSLQDPITFMLLLLVDIVENSVHLGLCLNVVISDVIFGPRCGSLSSSDCAAAAAGSSASGCGSTTSTIGRLLSVPATGDDFAVASRVGASMATASGERRATLKRDEDEADAKEAYRRHPRMLFICAGLFFAELLEVVVPLIMALGTAVLYSLPTKIRNYITFMQADGEQYFLSN